MKLGLAGDIHGNAGALRVMLEAASNANVDKLLITGDLVGYYFSPLQVCELLDEWEVEVVSGNHEKMLKIARYDPKYLMDVDARYGSGLRVALEQLNTDRLNTLCMLQHPLRLEIAGVRILLCHGSPWDIDQYIYPDTKCESITMGEIDNYDLIVTGHTHYPMELIFGRTRLVNPGSVGQPRNRKPGAHWAIFDTVTRSIEFRCEAYDTTELIRECKLRHPNLPYLAKVLERT